MAQWVAHLVHVLEDLSLILNKLGRKTVVVDCTSDPQHWAGGDRQKISAAGWPASLVKSELQVR